MKVKETGTVVKTEHLADDICSMHIRVSFAKEAQPGQFVSVFTGDKSHILPRPISICETNSHEKTIRLVYRIAGAGTRELSALDEGADIEVMGPLGHGFPVNEFKDKKVMLVGGGVGIPPMVECARVLKLLSEDKVKEDSSGKEANVVTVAGFRSIEGLFLLDELEEYSEVYVTSDDGSVGTKGTVVDGIRENSLTADVIFACGPRPMLKAVKEYAASHDIKCYVSMEERMACGIGACLACVCETNTFDPHFNVKKKRVCKDGPVFEALEVEL